MANIYSSTWAEAATDNNASPPDGWPGSTTFPNIPGTGREMMAAIKREWNLCHPTLTTGGDGDVITLTPATAITEYATGQIFAAKLNADFGAGGTSTRTLNVSGKGAKKIYIASYSGGHVLVSEATTEPQSGHSVFFRYDATLDSGNGGFVIYSYLPDLGVLESIELELTSENGTAVSAPTTPAFTFRLPYAFTFTDAKASVKTAPSGSALQVAPVLGSGGIFGSGHLTEAPYIAIDVGETTSETSAYPVSMTSVAANVASGSEINLFIVWGGSATGLKVTLLGYRQ